MVDDPHRYHLANVPIYEEEERNSKKYKAMMYGDLGYATGSVVAVIVKHLIKFHPHRHPYRLFRCSIEDFIDFFLDMYDENKILYDGSGGSVDVEDFDESVSLCYRFGDQLAYVEDILFIDYSDFMKALATISAYMGEKELATEILTLARKRTELSRKRKIDCIVN